MTANSPFDYIDYRQYLREFFEIKKAANPHYSFRLFSDKAGFKSKSFIQHVLDGKKNLSQSSIEKINTVLNLSGKQLKYFKLLVQYNQAATREHRNLYWEKMCVINPASPIRVLLKNEYEFFSKWYHKTIREVISLIDFKEDYQLLANLIRPPITAEEAHMSVELLLNMGLVSKTENGYCLTEPLLTTGDEVRSRAILDFHHENLQLAAGALDSVQSEQRDISSLVIALSDDGFRIFKEEIQQFRKRLLDIANNDTNMNTVYHMNFQLFPTSARIEIGDQAG